MSRGRVCWVVCAALWPGLADAQAQSNAPLQGLTVTAPAKPGPATSIDRSSYDITKDLTAQAGTIADALRNVPQVTVDGQGNVSLRGDPNVVILVDGKPSGQFQGANRAQALESLPADAYERVEVIANPTAALSPEGTGGVINLVTRQTRESGRSGLLRASADPTGRWNGTLSASQNSDTLALSFDAGVRHGLYTRIVDETRDEFAPPASDIQSIGTIGNTFGWTLRTGLDYDPDKATRLSAALHYNSYFNGNDSFSRTVGAAGAGPLDLVLNRAGRFHLLQGDAGLDASAHHAFGGAGDDLDLSLVVDRTDTSSGAGYTDVGLTPPLPLAFDGRATGDVLTLTDAKAEYQRPMPQGGKLTAGYELKIEGDAEVHTEFQDAATSAARPDPALSEVFNFDRAVHALYATYEQPLGKLTVLPGVRLEQSDVRVGQPAAGIQLRSADLHAYPSLHLRYALGGGQDLAASYSERINRPDPANFDPFRIIYSPFESDMGNPSLRPQQSENLDLSWDEKGRNDYLRAVVFYQSSTGGLAQAVTAIGVGDFLSTWRNVVASRSAGLQLEASGRLAPTLSYSLSGQLNWTQIDAFDLGLAAPRSAVNARGHVSLTWQPTKADELQLDWIGSTGSLTAEGYNVSWNRAALGYRRRFDDRFSAFVTLQDVLGTDRYGAVAITPLLVDRPISYPHGRVLFLGLAYAFGAGTKHDAQIDLGAQGAGGGQ